MKNRTNVKVTSYIQIFFNLHIETSLFCVSICEFLQMQIFMAAAIDGIHHNCISKKSSFVQPFVFISPLHPGP